MNGYAATTYRRHRALLAAGDDFGAVCRSAVAGCVMAGLKSELPAVGMVLVIGFLWLTSWAEHQKIKQLQAANTTLTQERDAARRILNNQQHTLQLLDTLSKAATDEKQRNVQHSDTVRAEVRPVLAAEPAARVLVPAVAAERVREAVSAVRTGAPGAAPR